MITTTIKYIFRFIALCLILYGAFLLGSPGYWSRNAQPSEELPLGLTNSLIVKNNVIYIGSKSYHRIQAYNINGEFLRGYSTRAPYYDVKILTSVNRLVVEHSYGTYIFNINTGEVIEYSDEGTYNRINNRTYKENGYTYYYASWSWLWPRVIQQGPDGSEEVVVCQPWSIWIRQAPFPALLFVLVGFIFGWCTAIDEISNYLHIIMSKIKKLLSKNAS